MDNEKIVDMLKKMDEELKAFEKELVRIQWIMRGPPLSEVYAMSPTQRQEAQKLYNDNLETSQKTHLPHF